MHLYLAFDKNFHSHLIQFQVGSNGRYQYRLFGFIFFTTFMCGINYYTQGNLCYYRVIVARNISILFSNDNILSNMLQFLYLPHRLMIARPF